MAAENFYGAVQHDSGVFSLSSEPDSSELRVTTELVLDLASEDLPFKVIPLLRTGLNESSIREAFLPSDKEATRIGWIIPANALSSSEHDSATDPHFLRFAYVTIREVLTQHQEMFTAVARTHQAQGAHELAFADLFHDNVCFLTVSMQRFPEAASLDWLKPSLIAHGYVPFGMCDPDTLNWSPMASPGGRKVKLKLISNGVSKPEVPIRMMAVAAASSSSPAVQFFYLYQVVEFLMELVLETSMSTVGHKIGKSIQDGQFQQLRDHLESFQDSMSEKRRLQLLIESCSDGPKAMAELERAAKNFLQTLGITAKTGIASLYQVRNFVVHQVRSMPESSEQQLGVVVHEFARFLPAVLATFEVPGYEPEQTGLSLQS